MLYNRCWISSAVCLLACVLSSNAVSAAATVEMLPAQPMSDKNQAAWWSPIGVHNGDIYVSYLQASAPQDNVVVAKWSGEGPWQIIDTGKDSRYDVGHTQTSLAIDGDGHLHLFYGMHNDSMGYLRTKNGLPDLAGGFETVPNAFPANGRYTYPNLTTAPNGDVFMIVRDRVGDNVRGQGQIYHWSNNTQSWSDPIVFAHENGYTVYPNQIYADKEGKLHIIWEWAKGGPQGKRHMGSYAKYDPETGQFYRANGEAYAAGPITTANSDTYQPLEAGEQWGTYGAQSGKITLNEKGQPLIAYGYSTTGQGDGFEHRLATWDGEKWARQTMSEGGMDIEKPWVTFSEGEIRYYNSPSPEDNDIYLRISDDGGLTWSDPQAITEDLSIQRPVGITVNGIDYLYLPSVDTGLLHVVRVTPSHLPEPSTSLIMVLGLAGISRYIR